MSKSDNRLSQQEASNDCGMTSVTATSSATACQSSKPEKQQSLDAIASQPAVGYVNASKTQNLGRKPSFNKTTQPTLKLRFGHSQSDAWEEVNTNKRQAAGHSRSSPVVQIPLKAITVPRRIPVSLDPQSFESTNSLSPRNSISNSIASKWRSLPQSCLPSFTCKEFQQQAQRLERLKNRLTFEQWLVTKRKEAEQLRRQLQRKSNCLTQQQQMRKQMSEKSYEEWLNSKQRQRWPTGGVQQAAMRQLDNQKLVRDRCRREETQRCVEQWERRKLHELQRQRELRMHEEENVKIRDQLRQQLSQLAWQRWLTQTEARESRKICAPLATDQRRPAQYLPVQRQCQRYTPTMQERKLQGQLHNLYLHVPLSAAQRSLQQRLNSSDGLCLQRRKK